MNAIFIILFLLIILVSLQTQYVEAGVVGAIKKIVDAGKKNSGKSWTDKVKDSRKNPGQNNKQVQKGYPKK